jgi:hypothetical protein
MEPCDICSGTKKTLKGDLCVCEDGTIMGLNRALRTCLLDQTRDIDALRDKVRLREVLLKDVLGWLTELAPDGKGQVLKSKIELMLGLDVGDCRFLGNGFLR